MIRRTLALRGDEDGLENYLLPLDARRDGGEVFGSGGQIGLHALQGINCRPCTNEGSRLSLETR